MNVDDKRQRLASMFGQNYPKTCFSDINSSFCAKFAPSEMRQLALVAHNHMKPAMKSFIGAHSEVLKKFRITGTNTTMTMCKTILGEDDDTIEYGATCCSGPLGGDAQIASLICMEDLGAIIFFIDPLSAHPHQADIDSLVRLAHVGNIILCPNPSTACGMMWMLRQALTTGNSAMIASFLETLESPSVLEYKANQKRALQCAVNYGGTGTENAAPAAVPQQAPNPKKRVAALPDSDSLLSDDSSSDERGDLNRRELLGLETGKININKKNDSDEEDDNSDTKEKAGKLVHRRMFFQRNRKRLKCSNIPNGDISCSTISKESVLLTSSPFNAETELRAVRNHVLTKKKMNKRKSATAASKIKEAASCITSATKYLNTPHRRRFFFLEKKGPKKTVANKSVEAKSTTKTLAATSDASWAHLIDSQKIVDKRNKKNWIIMKMESIQKHVFCIGQYLFLILAVLVIIQIPFVILGLGTVVFIKLMDYALGWITFVFAVTDFEFHESSSGSSIVCKRGDNGRRRTSLMERTNSRTYTYAWLSGKQMRPNR